jgi:hypothetical protein
MLSFGQITPEHGGDLLAKQIEDTYLDLAGGGELSLQWLMDF